MVPLSKRVGYLIHERNFSLRHLRSIELAPMTIVTVASMFISLLLRNQPVPPLDASRLSRARSLS
jgi:hypothetical protein